MEQTKNTSALCQRPLLGGSSATGALKVIALLCMICDHFGKMLFPSVTDLRVIGRIAYPVYCWCLVAGAHYTRSMPRYILRTLLLFVVSQPFYMIALNHKWSEPNIFLTLAISLVGLWGLREKRWGSQFWAPVLALALAQLTGANYGWKGVLLVLLLWGVRDSRAGIACVMAAFCLYWGSGSSVLKSLFGIPLGWVSKAGAFSQPLSAVFRLQAMAILSLPLIIAPMPEHVRSWKMNRWLSYGLYPGHLALLIVCELLAAGGTAAVAARWQNLAVQPLSQLLDGLCALLHAIGIAG